MITKPELPPKRGYVETEVNGVRVYKNVLTGEILGFETPNTTPSVWDEMAAAYKEGVQEA